MEIVVGSAVTTIQTMENHTIVYGTENGSIAKLQLEKKNTWREVWAISPQQKRLVNCISIFDFSQRGPRRDVIVGREDGTVEIYTASEHSNCAPELSFEGALHEAVTSVNGGFFTNPSFPDLICSTFSGKIVAFSTHLGNVSVSLELSTHKLCTA